MTIPSTQGYTTTLFYSCLLRFYFVYVNLDGELNSERLPKRCRKFEVKIGSILDMFGVQLNFTYHPCS